MFYLIISFYAVISCKNQENSMHQLVIKLKILIWATSCLKTPVQDPPPHPPLRKKKTT